MYIIYTYNKCISIYIYICIYVVYLSIWICTVYVCIYIYMYIRTITLVFNNKSLSFYRVPENSFSVVRCPNVIENKMCSIWNRQSVLLWSNSIVCKLCKTDASGFFSRICRTWTGLQLVLPQNRIFTHENWEYHLVKQTYYQSTLPSTLRKRFFRGWPP